MFNFFDWISFYRNLAQRTRCWWPVPLCRTALRNFGIPNNHQLAVSYFCIMLELFYHFIILLFMLFWYMWLSVAGCPIIAMLCLVVILFWGLLASCPLTYIGFVFWPGRFCIFLIQINSKARNSSQSIIRIWVHLMRRRCVATFWWRTFVAAIFPWLLLVISALWRNYEKVIMLVKLSLLCYVFTNRNPTCGHDLFIFES